MTEISVKGTIVTVGSNFVEVLVEDMAEMREDLDKGLTEKHHEEGDMKKGNQDKIQQ